MGYALMGGVICKERVIACETARTIIRLCKIVSGALVNTDPLGAGGIKEAKSIVPCGANVHAYVSAVIGEPNWADRLANRSVIEAIGALTAAQLTTMGDRVGCVETCIGASVFTLSGSRVPKVVSTGMAIADLDTLVQDKVSKVECWGSGAYCHVLSGFRVPKKIVVQSWERGRGVACSKISGLESVLAIDTLGEASVISSVSPVPIGTFFLAVSSDKVLELGGAIVCAESSVSISEIVQAIVSLVVGAIGDTVMRNRISKMIGWAR